MPDWTTTTIARRTVRGKIYRVVKHTFVRDQTFHYAVVLPNGETSDDEFDEPPTLRQVRDVAYGHVEEMADQHERDYAQIDTSNDSYAYNQYGGS